VVQCWLLQPLLVTGDMELTSVAPSTELGACPPEPLADSGGAPDSGRLTALAARIRPRLGTANTVWWLNGALVIAALLLWMFAIRGQHHPLMAIGVPWWCLGGLFFVGEAWVLHVHFGRSAYSFSLTEICYVLGLLFLDPNQLLLTQVCGIGLALVAVRRQSLLKLVFNLGHFTLETCVAIIVFRTLGGSHDATSVHTWEAIFVAGALVSAMGVTSIIAAISISEGDFKLARWRDLVLFTMLGALANTSLGLLAAVLIQHEPFSALLLTLPVLLLGIAYSAHMRERRRHERMEFLYEAGKIMSLSTEMDTTVVDVLRHARASFRASTAELMLFSTVDGEHALHTVVRSDDTEMVMTPVFLDPIENSLVLQLEGQKGRLLHLRDDGIEASAFLSLRQANDAMVCALVGETRVIGVMIVSGRLGGVATFDVEDVRQLEALAAQMSISLQNGQLERSLARLTELQHELEHQAFHDPLTGLANRVLFHDRVKHAIERASREQRPIAVLFLDLDDFKNLNDSVGHAAGDEVLIEVAKRLRLLLRPADTAARLGGDEFAVLLETITHEADAVNIAERVVEAIAVPMVLADGEAGMRGSVGIATTTGEEVTAEEMLRNADMAMYMAKAMGKGRWEMFAPQMHVAALERHQLKSDLLHSIERNQLRLQYQPIVHLPSGNVFGVEALLRWDHPGRGVIAPDDFIPVAEESDLIVAMGRHVLEVACIQAMEWAAQHPNARDLTITVNASGRELREPTFSAVVEDVVRRIGLDPRRLVIEVTESQLITDPVMLCEKLARLKGMGVRVAIDDFGTGYSSLSSLRQLPVDILKIAKPFVSGIGDSAADEAFVAAILQLGQSLGLTMIAEGVETHRQRDLLTRIQCPLAQGYLFGRPMDAEGISALLREGSRERVAPMLHVLEA
jgi:diguanylate cyclase (GGDEF)-like protein